MLELLDELPAGKAWKTSSGSVLDLIMSLSWGMYKWLCIVSAQPSERKARGIQLLDAPDVHPAAAGPESRCRLYRQACAPVRSVGAGETS